MSGTELRNIPPLWTALAHWGACMTYICLLPRKGGWKRLFLISGALLAALGALVFFFDSRTGLLFNLGKLATAVLTFLPFLALCRLQIAGNLYYCARAFIFGGFTASLCWQVNLYISDYFLLSDQLWLEILIQVPLYVLCFGLMFMLERTHQSEASEMPISPRTCFTTVAIALFIYTLSSASWASVELPFRGSTAADAYNLRTLVYLGGVAILYAFHISLCESHAVSDLQALQNVLNMQYANYRISQESIDLVNRKYHDLKHQIAVLRAGLENGPNTEQKLEYLDRMEQEIKSYEAQNKTGNEVLDTILTSKSLHCQKNSIQLTCVADGAALSFMDAIDLSTLFGNALDNAIESVVQLPDPKQRLIHLSVSRQKGFVHINLENRCAGNLTIEGRFPLTTKLDARNHGYGLRSIRQLAEKYGGSATVQANHGWFTLRVLIPQET